MAIQLDQLVNAFARAVVDAQSQIQQTHLGELSKFFKNGTPVSVKLHMPRIDPETGKHETKEISVPLMTLVKPGQLTIQEMQVTMQVDVTDIATSIESVKKSTDTPEKVSDQVSEWKQPEKAPKITTSTTTGKKPGDVGVAQVTFRIAAEETTEGLSRLLDHLNKSL